MSNANPSHQHAREINFEVKCGDTETIRLIGHAALAAGHDVHHGQRLLHRSATSGGSGCVAAHRNSTGECFGSKLVAARRDGPDVDGAAGTAWTGISKTWARTDVVAGSKRALVITLTNGYEGSLLSGIPHNIYREIDALKAVGTTPLLVIVGTPPGVNRR
ncbi:hypothetical protein [Mycolicibacterium sarraceniae]|uniref:Uncharacterized protein n=1 Tax=Mycolicibacterium sarraceniae TaxID=1534348 RepID=A0A7I7SM22_9MYCO|nr:hypothetical protein [Mycolicibacterium sarraceniae]BBY57461.1 hypothetical protein MSAR_05970 [Mycolicibacterium sarraceniae]